MGDSGGAPDKSSNDLIMTTLLCRTYRQNSCSILKLCKSFLKKIMLTLDKVIIKSSDASGLIVRGRKGKVAIPALGRMSYIGLFIDDRHILMIEFYFFSTSRV